MSVERRDRLVEQIVDAQPRLTIFLRPLPSELLAGSWDLLAERATLDHDDDDDLARDVARMIDFVQAYDPFADRFRYPTSKEGTPFPGIAVDLDELFQAH